MEKSTATTLVADCMSRNVITIGKYNSIAEVYETMSLNRIRRLPVMDKDALIGIISLSDILRFQPPEIRRYLSFAELADTVDNIIVDLVMTPNPVVVYQSDQIGYAASLMLEHKVGGLPVMDATKKLAGMLTESDIFRKLAANWQMDSAGQS